MATVLRIKIFGLPGTLNNLLRILNKKENQPIVRYPLTNNSVCFVTDLCISLSFQVP